MIEFIFSNLYFFYLMLFLGFLILIIFLLLNKKKKAEVQRDRIHMILDYLFDGLVIIDKLQRITNINLKAEEMLGIERKKIIGKTLPRKTENIGILNLAEIIPIMTEKGRGEWKDVIIKEPQNLVLRITPIPIFDGKGRRDGFIFVLHDVTREKEIDKIKSEFITTAAHKLRTPASIVKWSIGLLTEKKEKLSQEQIDILEKCRKANDKIISEIYSLLSVSEIEKGLFKYEFKFYLFEDILARAIQDIGHLAREKQVSLKYYKPKGTLPKIKVDKEKIEMALRTVLDNATRYNKKGGQVRIRVLKEKSHIILKIEDEGIGISNEDKKRVFSKFFRGQKATRIHTEGGGLSLFVAKNIVEKHKGKIWFKSEEGKGSTFYIKLPI